MCRRLSLHQFHVSQVVARSESCVTGYVPLPVSRIAGCRFIRVLCHRLCLSTSVMCCRLSLDQIRLSQVTSLHQYYVSQVVTWSDSCVTGYVPPPVSCVPGYVTRPLLSFLGSILLNLQILKSVIPAYATLCMCKFVNLTRQNCYIFFRNVFQASQNIVCYVYALHIWFRCILLYLKTKIIDQLESNLQFEWIKHHNNL